VANFVVRRRLTPSGRGIVLRLNLGRRGLDAPTGEILGVRTEHAGAKFALIEEQPEIYFTTPHFDGYPAVLVRLAVISVAELQELLVDAWLARAPKRIADAYLESAARWPPDTAQ
jgi:hypothetical protein